MLKKIWNAILQGLAYGNFNDNHVDFYIKCTGINSYGHLTGAIFHIDSDGSTTVNSYHIFDDVNRYKQISYKQFLKGYNIFIKRISKYK